MGLAIDTSYMYKLTGLCLFGKDFHVTEETGLVNTILCRQTLHDYGQGQPSSEI